MALKNRAESRPYLGTPVGLAAIATLVLAATASAAPPAGFVNESVVGGFVEPTAVGFLPDGRILILEIDGDIFIADPDANPVVASPYMTVPDVEHTDQRGMFDITLDPNFTSNGYFYVYYTHAPTARHRIARFTHQGTFADAGSIFLVWEDNETWQGIGHIGGGLDFGNDGLLYLATGDENDNTQSQDLTRSGGKVIRVTPTGEVPAGNPFDDGAGPNDDYVWARGLRNPTRARFDAADDRFYIADVGQDTLEEVHIGIDQGNFGWSDCEGDCGGNPAYDAPLFTYPHNAAGGSISGGYVSRGGFPSPYAGSYLFADFVQGWIRYATPDGVGGISSISDFDPAVGAYSVIFVDGGPDGSLYYVEHFTGTVRRIRYEGNVADYTDDFDRAGLGANWAVDNGSMGVSANRLIENTGQKFVDVQAFWLGGATASPDQFSKIQVTSQGSNTWGFILRANDPSGDHYEVHLPNGGDEWRWELMDPAFVARVGTCVGDGPVGNGDWLGAQIVGAGAATEVSVWRWDFDPGADPAVWGAPDCVMTQDPVSAVDFGTGLGVRSYSGNATSGSSADNWSAGGLGPAPVCGNSLIEPGEACDDGGASPTCDADCTFPVCGDGVYNPSAEQCEMDGDCTSGDICSGSCECVAPPTCGNSIPEAGEDCDEGAATATCDADCSFPICGDLTLNVLAGEQCEVDLDCAVGEVCGGCVCGQPPAFLSDDFDRASLGADWVVDAGSFAISNDQLVENSGQKFVNARLRYVASQTTSPDQFAKLRVVSPASHTFGFMFRVGDSSGHHYQVHLPGGGAQWRWELYDPGFVNRVDDCVGDSALSPGDYIGAQVEGAGAATLVSVWRWDTDPGDDPALWSAPDCTMAAIPSVAVDAGTGVGIRSYTGNKTSAGFADDWVAGALGPAPICGNSIVEAGEACDDGAATAACDADCSVPACGDGEFNPFAEQCEADGDCGGGDVCDASCVCVVPPMCGNGIVEAGEDCDDVGASATCDVDCTFATCGDGTFNPAAEQCEVAGDCLGGDICDGSCSCVAPPVCGNGVTEFGEDCDDAGESAACDANCTFAVCGDLTTNVSAGEQCEVSAECAVGEACNACGCGPGGATFTDDFDRPALGPDWAADSGSYGISSNRLVENSGQRFLDAQLRYVAAATFSTNQFGKLQVVSPAQHTFGFMFRADDPSGHHYEVHLPAGGAEWRWELYDPSFVERVGDCAGDGALAPGDWIGARIDGTATSTVVSVWRWSSDPGNDTSAWGVPDCQMGDDPAQSVDAGTTIGIRSYTGGSTASGFADNWTGGDSAGPPPPPTGGGSILRILGPSGAGAANSMQDPDGVVVDSLGNVYVGACGTGPTNEGLFKIAPDLQVTQVLGNAGDGVNTASCIVGIDVDSADNVYAAAFLSDNVFRVTPAGTITQVMDSSGAGAPDSLLMPIDVAVDADDNLYVSGFASDRVFKRAPGAVISEVLGPAGDGSTPLVAPFGIEADSAGNLYVPGFGTGSDAVFRVTPSGTVSVILDAGGDGSNPLEAPHAIAVDGDDNVFVSGNLSDNVFRVTPSGTITEVLDAAGDGQGNGLDNPTAIAADAAGNFYVTGFGSSNAFKVTPAGTVTEIIDITGDGAHGFVEPSDMGIDVDAAGNVYAAGTISDSVFRIELAP